MKMVYYYYYFHSIMNGLIFWVNSSDSKETFRIQKNKVIIIMCHKSRDSCRDLVKKIKMLPLQSQYIVSLPVSVAK
jgi:hypothetical protein